MCAYRPRARMFRLDAPDWEPMPRLWAHQRALLHVDLGVEGGCSADTQNAAMHTLHYPRTSSSTWCSAFMKVSDSSMSGVTASGRPARPREA